MSEQDAKSFNEECKAIAKELERIAKDPKLWLDLVARIAAEVNCLPSTFPDSNGHIVEAVIHLKQQLAAAQKERDEAQQRLRQLRTQDDVLLDQAQSEVHELRLEVDELTEKLTTAQTDGYALTSKLQKEVERLTERLRSADDYFPTAALEKVNAEQRAEAAEKERERLLAIVRGLAEVSDPCLHGMEGDEDICDACTYEKQRRFSNLQLRATEYMAEVTK